MCLCSTRNPWLVTLYRDLSGRVYSKCIKAFICPLQSPLHPALSEVYTSESLLSISFLNGFTPNLSLGLDKYRLMEEIVFLFLF